MSNFEKEDKSPIQIEMLKQLSNLSIQVEIEEVIGTGAFGIVLKGTYQGKKVAIKAALEVFDGEKSLAGKHLASFNGKDPYDHEFKILEEIKRLKPGLSPTPIFNGQVNLGNPINRKCDVLIMEFVDGQILSSLTHPNIQSYLTVMGSVAGAIDNLHTIGIADLDYADTSVFIKSPETNNIHTTYLDLGMAARQNTNGYVEYPPVLLNGPDAVAGTFRFLGYEELTRLANEGERDFEYFKRAHLLGFTANIFQDLFEHYHILAPKIVDRNSVMQIAYQVASGQLNVEPVTMKTWGENGILGIYVLILGSLLEDAEHVAFNFPSFVAVYEIIKKTPLLNSLSSEAIVTIFALLEMGLSQDKQYLKSSFIEDVFELVKILLDKEDLDEDSIIELHQFYEQAKLIMSAPDYFPGELDTATKLLNALNKCTHL